MIRVSRLVPDAVGGVSVRFVVVAAFVDTVGHSADAGFAKRFVFQILLEIRVLARFLQLCIGENSSSSPSSSVLGLLLGLGALPPRSDPRTVLSAGIFLPGGVIGRAW